MKNLAVLTEKEKAVIVARRAYMKQWRQKNPHKQKEYTDRYFGKLAAANQEKTDA